MSQVYSLCSIGYQGAEPQAIFTFTAIDMKDAISKAKNWGHYHGRKYQDDYTVKEAEGRELSWPTNNEYVRE